MSTSFYTALGAEVLNDLYGSRKALKQPIGAYYKAVRGAILDEEQEAFPEPARIETLFAHTCGIDGREPSRRRAPCMGYALELLARSQGHRSFPLGFYVRRHILPAFDHGQTRFFFDGSGMPRALVTWACLSEEVEWESQQTLRPLEFDEWNCGDRIVFNDWIVPYGNLEQVVADITTILAPESMASGDEFDRNDPLAFIKHRAEVALGYSVAEPDDTRVGRS
ncbi:toxin-activating lysine-acyltransferase [Pontivivens ytuae]|uniref:RTX toxin-activating lysine-acyltransferase n=1 Tax=Pontivivens ytuae TaxID=2789856 RepID=A0A7S9QC65_9RHOB|nr:toxin-activating lysine-acyltransferase [Pontivivens ytuae]QPH53883.1 toxin-activating lysine-acyltransferase [Pontivivens ytuae]